MRLIVATTKSWGIGREGDLPFHLSGDLKHFRALTTGGTVIMGRKTLDSLPGGRALPGRRNIVITRDRNFSRENVEAVHSLEEAAELVEGLDPDRVWVCGGGEIYRAMLPLCDRATVTRVEADPACDTFFPNLEGDPAWERAGAQDPVHEGDHTYTFVEYRRK